ncbi:Glycosyl transferase, family 3-like protein [Rippkaea orientalis PCC 8801]|uniref:Glycosyl transferase, family 3-like protein n=1 Tax=Rippkaea orientalis (strain PCC 8801 / RF-1) TaxID=41431 RepID=B7K3U0_RIPO1|nr:anthranilate phosphoribosyltransferase family protein [Rippkaea orientalis]ACK66480.1 Glycosyl transferase, family 3-like protein [Rippkaea orientalis PCC 8801]
MSNTFREYLKKIGSGTHTGKDLTRTEAADAAKLMLLGEATPAQIGAFLIAHRIKRPTAAELAGILDTYDEVGPKIPTNDVSFDYPVTVLGTPYDGRSRTVPVTPITALILATAGVPVVMHGGDRMGTKYGLPMVEIWQGLGIDFTQFSLTQVTELLAKTGLTFVYVPRHFPLINPVISYRNEIGKRPPLASIELIWSPCSGDVHTMVGFVHPPTEMFFKETFELRGVKQFTTIKGLEGSCDLPLSRTAIIGLAEPDLKLPWERLLLHPKDYGFGNKDIALDSETKVIEQLQGIINGESNELISSVIYNGGFYLWRCGVCADLKTGFEQAETLLNDQKVSLKLQEIINFTNS